MANFIIEMSNSNDSRFRSYIQETTGHFRYHQLSGAMKGRPANFMPRISKIKPPYDNTKASINQGNYSKHYKHFRPTLQL